MLKQNTLVLLTFAVLGPVMEDDLTLWSEFDLAGALEVSLFSVLVSLSWSGAWLQ